MVKITYKNYYYKEPVNFMLFIHIFIIKMQQMTRVSTMDATLV